MLQFTTHGTLFLNLVVKRIRSGRPKHFLHVLIFERILQTIEFRGSTAHYCPNNDAIAPYVGVVIIAMSPQW